MTFKGLFLSFATLAHGLDSCRELASCVQCTESSHVCGWDADSARCHLRTSLHSSTLVFDDTCPVDYGPVDSFSSNWMGRVMSVIGDSTVLDLSLPGTHDTLTYDLSTTVSEGGIDELYTLAELLHNETALVPDAIEDFMRTGAQTQDLTVAQQLDAGVRFLDVRAMLQYSDAVPEWYSLHMMQSTYPSLQYFREIRAWLDAHPAEVVVLWLSKHGSECATGQDQYPNVSIEQKRGFWADIMTVFDGVALDFSRSKLNETSLRTLVARNHRAVFYVADYVEMTGYDSSTTSDEPYFALDSCLLDNQLGNPSGPSAVQHQRSLYAAANERKRADKAGQRLYLMSLAGDMEYVEAALLQFGRGQLLPRDEQQLVADCAAAFDTPGMAWCPETLLDGSQLSNYYSQVALDEVLQQMLAGNHSSGLPHAIYINAVGALDGSIRTGTEVLWGKTRSPDEAHAQQGFSYVDSFVLYNVLRVCREAGAGAGAGAGGVRAEDCRAYTDLLVERRALKPLTLWDDAAYGRLAAW